MQTLDGSTRTGSSTQVIALRNDLGCSLRDGRARNGPGTAERFLEELDECPKPERDELAYAVVNVYQSSGCV